MRTLDHPNIIKLLDYSDGTHYVNHYGQEATVVYIASELCDNGNLYDWVANTGAFSEEIARYYFHQLISGLEYLHTQGMSHRDLKLENIMLDDQFKLKIGDFGFASVKACNDTRKGTHGYMAPEIEIGVKYNGGYADIFSAGVILFTMVSQHLPFTFASFNDIYFKLLSHNQVDFFWKKHQKENRNQRSQKTNSRRIIHHYSKSLEKTC